MSVRVRDIMVKDVVTIHSEKTVYDAAKLMSEKMVGCLIVVENGYKPVGIITERDFVRRVLAKDKDPHKTLVKEVMSTPLISVRPELSVVVASQEMAEHKIRRLAVVEDDKLVGIVTSFDLTKNFGEVANLFVSAILRGLKLGSLMG